jgi:hypothetical protein
VPPDKFRTWKDVYTARLYHYEKFCPAWLATTLKEKTIHCANPTKLNDPWDCKPWFHKRPDDTGPAISWASLSVGTQNEIAKRRIYCLTPDPLSILMWSHYAADHTGICLEFHIGNLLFTKVMGVVYEEEFPAIRPTEMYERVHDVLLTKAKCWSYEEEFRLLGSPYIDESNPLKLHGDFLNLPDLALMSVIVGCKGEYDAVKQIVNDNAPDLRVTQIIRAPNEYKLLMGLASDSERKKKMLSWPRPLTAA